MLSFCKARIALDDSGSSLEVPCVPQSRLLEIKGANRIIFYPIPIRDLNERVANATTMNPEVHGASVAENRVDEMLDDANVVLQQTEVRWLPGYLAVRRQR